MLRARLAEASTFCALGWPVDGFGDERSPKRSRTIRSAATATDHIRRSTTPNTALRSVELLCATPSQRDAEQESAPPLGMGFQSRPDQSMRQHLVRPTERHGGVLAKAPTTERWCLRLPFGPPPTQHIHGQHSVPDELQRRGAEKDSANALANPNPSLDLNLWGSGDNGNGVETTLQQTRVGNPVPATINPPLVTAQAPVPYWTQPLAQGTVDEEEGGYAINWDRRGQIALTVPRHFMPTAVSVDLDLPQYAQYKKLVEHFRPVAELDWTAPPPLPLTTGQSFLPHPISLLQPVVPHSTPAESASRKTNDVVLDLTADEDDGPVGGEPAGHAQGMPNDPTLPPSILAYLATVEKARKPTHFACKRQLNCSPDFALATNHNQLTRIRFTAVAFEAHNTLFHPHVGADLRSQQCGWVTSGRECLHRAQAGDLMKHVERVHLSGFPCMLCEEMYPSREALTAHMRACVPPVDTSAAGAMEEGPQAKRRKIWERDL
ncbi:Glycosyltransferase family 15 protein [Mycena chlorophos]|uniref:Glycosyltransferase family 15 protein n=1 Tax=Mycena chlorophos TaxID=658473 RepID=A0A8H6WCU7_MYCCL|nr:Glycosyltransferase family 15 protein [Mycena chlorophos]